MAELAARDARIAARRARVQARLAAANSAKKDHRKSRLEIEQDAGVGDRQLSKSLHSLAEFRRKLKEEVKALRDGADFREYEHRMGETSKGEALEKRMRLEIQDSNSHNEEIAEKWKIILELNGPQDVAKQMAEQKKVPHQLFHIELQVTDDLVA